MLLTCTPAVFGLMYSSAPISALVRPAASSRSTASSRSVSPYGAGAGADGAAPEAAGIFRSAPAGGWSEIRARSASVVSVSGRVQAAALAERAGLLSSARS